MFSNRLLSALAAAALLSMAAAESSSSKIVSIPTPTTTVPAAAMSTIGCFETGVPLEDHGKGYFVTAGSCQQICLGLEKDVLGLSDGDHCWCGDEYPPKDSQVDNSTCSTSCSGDDRTTCGGRGLLWVMSTGQTRNEIPFYVPDDVSSSSTSSSSTSTSTTSASSTSQTAPAAVVTSAPAESEKKGPNTVGIAVGVVVGVLVLAALIGGVFFYLRRQRRLAVEEEYRRQAAVNQFTSGGKLHTSNSSMTDSRLDPEFMARRQSNGSIADNEDYSRRILKVTNA